MIGQYLSYRKYPPYVAYDSIKLTEPHEAGEIIDKYWLIMNNPQEYDRDLRIKYKAQEYVNVVDIRYLDMFETDINYDNRNDLKKIGTQTKMIMNPVKCIKVNIYGYMGINTANIEQYDSYKLRRGVTRFVSEYTNQNYGDASENNCEMIDWIISCIEKSFKEKN